MSLLSRRDALAAGLGVFGAAILGEVLPAQAKSGDSPKISIFGLGGQSSPFSSGVQSSGTVQYEPYNDEEMAYFKKVVEGSADRLSTAKDSIDARSWEDIRSIIRLEMSLLRKTVVALNKNIRDSKVKKSAEVLYDAFKKDVNDLDYACVTKNQERAMKSYKLSLKDLSSWRNLVGI